MSELPKVFTVLDEINEIHLEASHALRTRSMTNTEQRINRLFEIAKQQAMDIYALERELATTPGLIATKMTEAPDPAYLVHTGQIPPGHLLFNEETLLKALDEPAFDVFHSGLLKNRVHDLFKKP